MDSGIVNEDRRTTRMLSAGDTTNRMLAEQSAQLREAQSVAQVGSFHWTIGTDLLEWSEELYRIFGYTPADFSGCYDAYFERIHPDDKPRIQRLVKQSAADGIPWEHEYRILRADGEVRWVVSRCRVVRDFQGVPVAMEGTCQDVTDRKRVEEKVRRLNEFHEALIRTAAEGICVSHRIDQHPFMRFSVWNDRMKQITGFTQEEINHRGWHDCLQPDPILRERAIERIERMLLGDHLRSETWEICRKDGETRTLAVSTSQVLLEEGRPATAAMIHDITDRILAERAVRESEARFAQFVEAMPQIVWMASADNKRHYFVNSAYEKIMGLKAGDLLDRPLDWLSIVHPLDRERVAERVATSLPQVQVEEFRIIRKDGAVRWIEHRVIPILSDQGNVYMHVGLSEDITARKQAEEDKARQQAQLAKASRLSILGEMVAGITHEITQPLTAILNFAGACAALLENEDRNPQELREYIEEIRRQSARAGTIVHGLRSLVRKANPRREVCPLNDLIAEGLALIQPDLRRTSVELCLELDPVRPVVLMDRVQFQQVLVNLSRNACDALQATPASNRRLWIRTRVFGSWVDIECEDNGTGLPAEQAQQLFKAFYTTKPDGMGMGLAICRTIVERHGGRIRAETGQHGGALLRVSLPLFTGDTGEASDDS